MYICCDEVAKHIEMFGEWQGGSHYHCGNCGEKSSMMGHYHSVHFKNGKMVKLDEGHFGCSDECDQRT